MAPADRALRPRASIGEYLSAERVAAEKHEYWGGDVFAMAGASLVHNRIVANLLRELGLRLLDHACEPLPSDMKVFVPSKPGFVYPDVSVVCGEPRFHDEEHDVLVNPTVIIEVLSDTTERFDRGDKLIGYRSVASIQQVALVSQQERRVEVFTRDGDRWILQDTTDDGVARLRSIDCELPLRGVYRGVPGDALSPEGA
jgi:Uma2 family endonuclease